MRGDLRNLLTFFVWFGLTLCTAFNLFLPPFNEPNKCVYPFMSGLHSVLVVGVRTLAPNRTVYPPLFLHKEGELS